MKLFFHTYSVILMTIMFLCMVPCLHCEVVWDAASLEQYLSSHSGIPNHLLLYFFKEGSGGCHLMETRTFNDPLISEKMSTLGRIGVDCNSGEGLNISKEYNIPRFPSMILLDSGGQEISRRIGMLPPREFLIWLNNGLQGKNILSEYLARLEKNPDDINNNLNVARIYRDRMKFSEAAAYYRKVRELDPHNEQGLNAIAIFELAHLFYEAGRHENSVILYKLFLKKYPRDKLAEIAYLDLIHTYETTGQLNNAVAVFRVYRDLYEHHYRVHYKFALFCLKHNILKQEALNAALIAVRLNDKSVDLLETLALTYSLTDKCQEAYDTIQRALLLNPSSEHLQELSEKYRQKKCREW